MTLGLPRHSVAVTVVRGHTPPGALIVPGVMVGDTLLAVHHVPVDLASNADVTADYEISNADEITSAGGATPTAPDSDGDYLVVSWARPA